MKSYIFITAEGYTFQPESTSIEPDIENCQVVGFSKGMDEDQAFDNMIKENRYLLETSFDEVICLELKDDYWKHKTYFHLEDLRAKEKLAFPLPLV